MTEIADISFGLGLLGALLGAVVGGVVTWVTAKWQMRKELEYGYDKELRTERLAVYRDVWKLSEPTTRFHSRGNPTGTELQAAIEDCHRWYFDVGGLFLSADARSAYFAMMNLLRVTADESGTAQINTKDVDDLFAVGERLRIQLAFDVRTGRAPELTTGRVNAAPPHPRSRA